MDKDKRLPNLHLYFHMIKLVNICLLFLNDVFCDFFKSLLLRASLVAQLVKNLPAVRETRIRIPGLGRSAGEGNGNPLQCPCLENLMDRGAWWAAVHGVAESW